MLTPSPLMLAVEILSNPNLDDFQKYEKLLEFKNTALKAHLTKKIFDVTDKSAIYQREKVVRQVLWSLLDFTSALDEKYWRDLCPMYIQVVQNVLNAPEQLLESERLRDIPLLKENYLNCIERAFQLAKNGTITYNQAIVACATSAFHGWSSWLCTSFIDK